MNISKNIYYDFWNLPFFSSPGQMLLFWIVVLFVIPILWIIISQKMVDAKERKNCEYYKNKNQKN